MSHREIIAKDGWGHVPEWIVALIKACDRPGSSQNKVAKELGVSATTVSQSISNKYQGDMARIEDRVRSVFLNGNVKCPALGAIGARVCLSHRDQAQELRSASPMKVRMFKACNACPRFKPKEEETDHG